MAQPSIRRAVPSDAEAIHALMLQAFSPYRAQYTPGCFDATVLDPERIRERIQEGPMFVAERNGIVGCVGCAIDDSGLYIRGLAVDPRAQRTGTGRRLLDACQEFAAAEGLASMWLSTTLFLAPSIALYQSYGFVDAEGPPELEGTALRSFSYTMGAGLASLGH